MTTAQTIERYRPAPRQRRIPLVLLVDDSPDALEMYGTYLTHRGFSTSTAIDGQGAIQLAARLRPDVIVIDLAVPRLGGVATVHALKRAAGTRNIPIIMLTGYPAWAIERGVLGGVPHQAVPSGRLRVADPPAVGSGG